MVEADELAVHPAVTPGWVLGCEARDELTDFRGSRRPSRSSGGLGPAAGDASAVPTPQGVGGNDPAVTTGSGERGCDWAKEGPVVVVELGSTFCR